MRIQLIKCCTALSLAAVSLLSCSRSYFKDQAWKEAAPMALFTSPTAFRKPAVSVPAENWSIAPAATDYSLLRFFNKFFGSLASADESTEEPRPVADLVQKAKRLWEKSPYEAALEIDFDAFPKDAPRCFGPSLEFNGELHGSGKLGMLSASEPPVRGSEACAAAQMNYLVQLAGTANAALKSVLLLVSTLREEGIPLAQGHDTLDVTKKLPRLGANTLVTKATLSRKRNSAAKIYVTQLEIHHLGKAGFLINEYQPMNGDGSRFRGVLKGIIPYVSPTTKKALFRAVAMTYEREGTHLNYLLEMAANVEPRSGEFFKAKANRIDFSHPAFGEEGYRYLASFNPETNEGSMKVAWMDDSRDTASRVFEVRVGKLEKGLLGGYAYFGFGRRLSELDEHSKFWITKFHPAWPTEASISGKCQGQKFSQTQVGGPFLSTEFHGPFVPTSTGTGSGVISGNLDLNGTTTIHSLDLVTPGELGAIDVPVPSSSFN